MPALKFWLIFGIPVVVAFSYLTTLEVTDAILSYTAFAIILYTIETASMRKEIAHQTELTLRPVIAGDNDSGNLVLVNVGQGVAVNIRALPITLKTEGLGKYVKLHIYPPGLMKPGDRQRIDTIEAFSTETKEKVPSDLSKHFLTPKHASGETEVTIEYHRVDAKKRYRSVIVIGPNNVRLKELSEV